MTYQERVSGHIVLGTQPVTGSHKGLVLVWHQVVPEGDHVAPASTQRRRMWSPWWPVPVLDDLNPRCRAVPGDQGGTGGGTWGSSHTGRTSRLTVVATTLMNIKGLVTKCDFTFLNFVSRGPNCPFDSEKQGYKSGVTSLGGTTLL